MTRISVWRPVVVLALVVQSYPAVAQAPPKPEFEVASIKPSPPSNGPRDFTADGGPGNGDATRASWSNAPLLPILTRAYNVWSDQIAGSSEVISQLKSDLYDIVVRIPPGTTKDQFRVMLQNLLADRFHLTLHHETRAFDGYELVVGKNGSKLREMPDADSTFDFRPGGLTKDANGVWRLERPGTITFNEPVTTGRPLMTLLLAREQSLDPLRVLLNMNLNKHWVDKTGLTGMYDYRLEFAPENLVFVNPDGSPIPPSPPQTTGQTGAVADDPAPNLSSALQQQLGLRLDSGKIPLDVLVISHLDKTPTSD